MAGLIMTRTEKEALAQAKGVSVATVNRWVRLHGEQAAQAMRRTSPAEAGRLSRASNPGYGRGWYARANLVC